MKTEDCTLFHLEEKAEASDIAADVNEAAKMLSKEELKRFFYMMQGVLLVAGDRPA